MIPEPMLEDDSLPLSLGHFAVDKPANGQGNAAEDQQCTKWLEDQAD